MKHEAFFNTHVWYTFFQSKTNVGRHTRAYACNGVATLERQMLAAETARLGGSSLGGSSHG